MKIGSSLEASPQIYLQEPEDFAKLEGLPFDEILISSGAEVLLGTAPMEDKVLTIPESLPPGKAVVPTEFERTQVFRTLDVPGVEIRFEKARGEKCARCWRVLEEVIHHPDTHLCGRCTDAVAALEPE
jgi:isoleucyl-tRNA synthetase